MKHFEDKVNCQSLYTRDYKIPMEEDLTFEQLEEQVHFLNSKKGNIWTILGLSKILEDSEL